MTIYVIRRTGRGSKNSYFKIGFTGAKSASSRLGDLQVGSPDRLTVVALFDGGKNEEARLHKALRCDHVRGEWFKDTAFVRSTLGLPSGRIFPIGTPKPNERCHRDSSLSVAEVARRLGVSTATVYAIVHRGELPHVRVSNAIRIEPAELDAYLKRNVQNDSPTPTQRRKPE